MQQIVEYENQDSDQYESESEEVEATQHIKYTKAELKEKRRLQEHHELVNQHLNKAPTVIVKHNRESEGGNYDLVLNKISVTFGGKTLLEDTPLKLAQGRKYGLIGRNGIGKTCFMNALAREQFQGIPKHLQILLVEQQLSQTSKSILQTVLDTDVEREQLLQEEQVIIHSQGKDTKRLQQIYKRLDEIDSKTAESRARKLLGGLGFRNQQLLDPMSSLSGGWRVRVALARALFVKPDILLLDQPTNHLDLDAVMWLEDYIENCESTVVVVSHDRSFLNAICTDTIHFFEKKLKYYKGNYDTFEKTRNEVNLNQNKQYQKQQDEIIKSKTFIDKFRANNKRASMVQSKIKQLEKVELVQKVVIDQSIHFRFPKPEALNGHCLKIEEGAFAYEEDKWILKQINFAANMQTRISIVGANGAGKSTLLKLLIGKIQLTQGNQYRNSKLKVSIFTQHHIDQMDMALTPLQQIKKEFPGFPEERYRAHLSSFGIINKMALQPNYTLSGGQKSRVAFATAAWSNPQIMILDEPTNHLDLDAVNALIDALQNFQGGIVIVSHDEHLISHVCEQIWYIKDKRLKKFKGDFQKYRSCLLNGKL